MPQTKFKKQIFVFTFITLCGFAASYFFLKKKNQHASIPVVSTSKTDSASVVELLTTKIDFENEATASMEKAASGKRSYKLTPQIEYGYGANKMTKDIPDYQSMNQIIVELKCWIKKKIDAVYVLSIEDASGKNIWWDSNPITCEKNETWSDVHFTFKLKPDAIKPDYIIKLYPWNKAKEEFFIDDISVHYNGLGTTNNLSEHQTSTTNFFYDFETTEGLTGTETIKQTTAHSGKMACDLSGGKEYGPLVIKNTSTVSTGSLKKISASVWVYPLKDNPVAVLTASISNSKGESVFWDGKSTNKLFTKNKWTKLNANFILPFEKISPDDKIQVNVWNKSRTDLIIDDMEIVYGETPDRKGEASTIDANTIYEKQFVPQKNKPPFQTIYFTKQEINTSSISNFTPNDEFIVGDFIKDKNNLDEIICIRNGKTVLFAYSPETKQFKAVIGKSFSIDSLVTFNKSMKYFFSPRLLDNNKLIPKSTDVIFIGDYSGNKKQEILEFNSDWRFDLKLIELNKTEYTTLGAIDFNGYANDYNPKYYEFTKILSGNFVTTNKTSIIIISCNCADANFNGKHCNQLENNPALPNSVSLYSIENR